MTTVQVIGVSYDEAGYIQTGVSDDEAELYAVYFGEPGGFMWAADFFDKRHALAFAEAMAESEDWELDDKTYEHDKTTD